MNEEFNKRWEKYNNGEMNEEEMTAFEEELEENEKRLSQELNDSDWSDFSISPEKQRAILQYGKRKSYLRISVLAVISTLIILPLCTLGSYLYYGVGGAESKGNHFMETAAVTVALTKPNVAIDMRDLKGQVKLFGMNTELKLRKQIGNQTEAIGSKQIEMFFDRLKQPTVSYYGDSPLDTEEFFSHPSTKEDSSKKQALTTLDKLPEGTVSEVYVSYDRAYAPKDVYDSAKKYDMKVLWNAIKTEDSLGEQQRPIGFPGKDATFLKDLQHASKTEEDQFKDALSYVNQHPNWAKAISGRPELDLSNRIRYINENGVTMYGSVVTGPTKEIEKFVKTKRIKSAIVSEVELWNW
ncbi:anti-sigma factor [Bacillus sp. 179-C3.3 HS]|uniref:anti-sigma factor n=1 Tax=Bacillus sp. 179-C3.3 HS TaxID=3232162 RepID=UPI0039A23945